MDDDLKSGDLLAADLRFAYGVWAEVFVLAAGSRPCLPLVMTDTLYGIILKLGSIA